MVWLGATLAAAFIAPITVAVGSVSNSATTADVADVAVSEGGMTLFRGV